MGPHRYAVIGAGAGGQSMAAYLAYKGQPVKLHDINRNIVGELNEAKSIRLTGAYDMEAFPELVTGGIGEALDGAEIILIVTTADVHEEVARAVAPFLKENMLIVLNPGFTGGALAFSRVLKNCKAKNVTVAETADLMFTCRKIRNGEIMHTGRKKIMELASLPAVEADGIVDMLKPVFPMLKSVPDTLHTGLKNTGAILHPIPSIMNVNRIDEQQNFAFYTEGITENIARMMEAADMERISICNALNIDVPELKDSLHAAYGVEKGKLCAMLRNNAAYSGIKGPTNLEHRFIVEDTLCGLVPMASIAAELNLPTPVISSFINIIGAATGRDMWREGRTSVKLGIEGMSVAEIRNAVE